MAQCKNESRNERRKSAHYYNRVERLFSLIHLRSLGVFMETLALRGEGRKHCPDIPVRDTRTRSWRFPNGAIIRNNAT